MRISDWSSDVCSSDLTMVAAQPNVSVIDGEAIALDLAGGRVSGVTLADGAPLRAPMVILATGTFLGGRLFCGDERGEGGRTGYRAETALGVQLRALALPISTYIRNPP